MSRYLGFQPTTDSEFYFVSYNSEDAERVGKIVSALADAGIRMWYDYGLEYGEKWETTIAKKIDDSKAVILFFTESILKKRSSFVKKEFKMASEAYHKKIYIVMMDEIKTEDVPHDKIGWWLDIKELQCINAFSGKESSDLKDLIVSAIGETLQEKENQNIPVKPDKKLRRTQAETLKQNAENISISAPEEDFQNAFFGYIPPQEQTAEVQRVQIADEEESFFKIDAPVRIMGQDFPDYQSPYLEKVIKTGKTRGYAEGVTIDLEIEPTENAESIQFTSLKTVSYPNDRAKLLVKYGIVLGLTHGPLTGGRVSGLKVRVTRLSCTGDAENIQEAVCNAVENFIAENPMSFSLYDILGRFSISDHPWRNTFYLKYDLRPVKIVSFEAGHAVIDIPLSRRRAMKKDVYLSNRAILSDSYEVVGYAPVKDEKEIIIYYRSLISQAIDLMEEKKHMESELLGLEEEAYKKLPYYTQLCEVNETIQTNKKKISELYIHREAGKIEQLTRENKKLEAERDKLEKQIGKEGRDLIQKKEKCQKQINTFRKQLNELYVKMENCYKS